MIAFARGAWMGLRRIRIRVEVHLGIDRAGRLTIAPEPDAEVPPGRYVLPGLVDAHALCRAKTSDGRLVRRATPSQVNQ